MIVPLLGETKVLDLSLSDRCTNRCLFCGDVRGKIAEPSTEQVERRLKDARREGYDGLELSSKEFTLRSDALVLVRRARELGFRMVHLVTNGQSLADPAAAARVLDAGVNKLTISLHSDRPELEAAVTLNPAGFDKKVAAIANVLSLLPRREAVCVFSVNTVMTPKTAPFLDRIMGFVAGLGVRRHNVYFPRVGGFMADDFDRAVPRFSELAAPLSRGLEKSRAAGVVCSVVDVPPCVVPEHAHAVCPRLAKDVYRGKAGAAPRTAAFDARREKVKGSPCGTCAAADACEGVYSAYVERRGWSEFTPLPRSNR